MQWQLECNVRSILYTCQMCTQTRLMCRRFQCNLCGMVCECPPEYYCATDRQGKRLDYHQRPELSQGSVEFIAPQEYMVMLSSYCPINCCHIVY